MITRRQLLTGAGMGFSIPGLWYVVRPPRRSISVRFWFSDRAAQYDGVRSRVESYLERAMSAVYDDVTVSNGKSLPVRSEDGYWVTRSGEWPQRVVEGIALDGEIDSVADVNLLITDGEMERAPTGAALPNIASVGGGRYLSALPPRSAVDDVVPLATPTRVMQTLLHEVGHALGLRHEHGSIDAEDGSVVVSPMVGTYAWEDDRTQREQFDAERNACGSSYPSDRNDDRYLSYSFSNCEVEQFRRYSGGLFP